MSDNNAKRLAASVRGPASQTITVRNWPQFENKVEQQRLRLIEKINRLEQRHALIAIGHEALERSLARGGKARVEREARGD
jgi:hypothetical protein